MRYLAIDYGARRVGLALCDPAEIIVSPLRQLTVKKNQSAALIAELKAVVDEHGIDAVIIGLPLNMDDTEGPQARQVRQFAARLGKHLNVPIHFQDERLSSLAADDMLDQAQLKGKKRRGKRDMLAACDILQSFLDAAQR